MPIIKIGSNLAQVEDDRVRYSTHILQLLSRRSVLIIHNELYTTTRASPTIAGISCPPPLSPHTDTDHSALRHAKQHRQRASIYSVKEEKHYSLVRRWENSVGRFESRREGCAGNTTILQLRYRVGWSSTDGMKFIRSRGYSEQSLTI